METTVKDLIDILSTFPGDRIVVIDKPYQDKGVPTDNEFYLQFNKECVFLMKGKI